MESKKPEKPVGAGAAALNAEDSKGYRVDARDLLGADRVLRITHRGEEYILRVTKNEKLILTK